MAQEYEYELFQGEAFYREFVLRDEAGEFEDLSNATVSIDASPGLTSTDFIVQKTGDPGAISINSPSNATAVWPIGVFDIHLKITWSPVDTVDVELIVIVRITIRQALVETVIVDGIQGGVASTDFSNVLDGGIA